MLRIILVLIFGFSLNIYSFPIPMNANWQAKEGMDLNIKYSPKSWQKFDTLPITVKDITLIQPGNIATLTLYNSFNVEEANPLTIEEDISLHVPFIGNVYEIYLNNYKIVSEGEIQGDKVVRNGAHNNVNIILPHDKLRNGKNDIYIVIRGDRRDELALYGSENMVIDYHSNNQYLVSERIDLMLLFLYLFVGVYHVMLFIKRPKDKHTIFFGSFCISLCAYLYSKSNSVVELGLDPYIKNRIEFILLYTLIAFFVLFFEVFFRDNHTLYAKIYLGFLGLISFLTIFVPKYIANYILLTWQITSPLVMIYTMYLIITALRKKDENARRLIIGFAFLIITTVIDLFGAMRIIPGLADMSLVKYGFFGFVAGIALVLSNKSLTAFAEVEELKNDLEKKVDARTKELKETLNDIQKLKTQQDGDYFLTTLLIKPLMVNQAQSDHVKIEFFIKQKKDFEFRGKRYEIGGDICIANNIYLKGKKYCAFINGDAMGKSIQGAGGALVLGVVFRAIITRTQGKESNLFPEIWLKNCFVELQNVFVSFDGTMLISIVMGLVEEDSGMLYFVNAEHPWTVLYKNQKAEFLENELHLRKIGMVGIDGYLLVETYLLGQNDSVIIGSDGRDDILISFTNEGQRTINEDETLFLKYVEQGNGELKKITDLITASGELTDDYTLLKVTYLGNNYEPEGYDKFRYNELLQSGNAAYSKGNLTLSLKFFNEAIGIFNSDTALIKKMIKIYFNLDGFKEVATLCEKYLSLHPEDSEYYFIMSYSLKMSNNLAEAAEYGECLKLREPENIKNLLNLADIYRELDNLPRAKKLVGLVLDVDEKNSKAIELLDYIYSLEENR